MQGGTIHEDIAHTETLMPYMLEHERLCSCTRIAEKGKSCKCGLPDPSSPPELEFPAVPKAGKGRKSRGVKGLPIFAQAS